MYNRIRFTTYLLFIIELHVSSTKICEFSWVLLAVCAVFSMNTSINLNPFDRFDIVRGIFCRLSYQIFLFFKLEFFHRNKQHVKQTIPDEEVSVFVSPCTWRCTQPVPAIANVFQAVCSATRGWVFRNVMNIHCA